MKIDLIALIPRSTRVKLCVELDLELDAAFQEQTVAGKKARIREWARRLLRL